MAAALTEGLSIEASLDGLSLGADPHTHTNVATWRFSIIDRTQCCVKTHANFTETGYVSIHLQHNNQNVHLFGTCGLVGGCS